MDFQNVITMQFIVNHNYWKDDPKYNLDYLTPIKHKDLNFSIILKLTLKSHPLHFNYPVAKYKFKYKFRTLMIQILIKIIIYQVKDYQRYRNNMRFMD